MTDLHPVSDIEVWARFIWGFLAIVAIPGYWWVGRFLCHTDLWTRAYLSTAFGILMVPPLSRMISATGIPLAPFSYLTVVAVGGLVLGRLGSYGAAATAVGLDEDRSSRWIQVLVAIACLYPLILMIWGFRDYPVPPQIHDATNHAFMTERIVSLESTSLSTIWGPPYGSPDVLYLFGWHAAAALIARLTGLAPYIPTWLLSLICLAALPAAWATLWRRWGFPALACVAAAFLVHANHHFPMRTLHWGGFGLLVGMYVAPAAALILVPLLRGGRLWNGLLAGIGLAAMVHIHGSELVVVLVLTLVTLLSAPAGQRELRVSISGLAALLLTAALAVGIDVVTIARSYQDRRMTSPAGDAAGIQQTLEVATRSGGQYWPQRVLLAIGSLVALRVRRLRPAVAALLVFIALVFAMRYWLDPVSMFLTQPFYRESGRVLAVHMLFAPPLMAMALTLLFRTWRKRWRLPASIATIATIAIVAFTLWKPLIGHVRHDLRGQWLRDQTVFHDDDYEMAQHIDEFVPAGVPVANYWNDGSSWVMHVSGHPVLVPCFWALGDRTALDPRPAIASLATEPWPLVTWALADRGIDFVYVRDTHRGKPNHRFQRQFFDADPRFERLAVGQHSALYRILWAKEPVPRPVRFGTGWGAREHWGRWALEQRAEIIVDALDRPCDLMLDVATFDGQSGPQRVKVSHSGVEVGVFSVEGRPWQWQSFRIPLPREILGSTATLDLEFDGRWPGNAEDTELRACPVRKMYVAPARSPQ